MKKLIQFSDFQKHHEFSQGVENTAKNVLPGDTAKIAQPYANLGFAAPITSPVPGQLGGKHKSSKKTVAKVPAAVKPAAIPTPGPEGYKVDCAQMTPGQLHAAYPSEYTSWKDSKSRCKQKGWPWASEWTQFRDFLLSMGSKPSATYTLDRKDNSVGAYGPDLCRWASKADQNNNKSDNVKIVIPLTGKTLSAQQIAAMHKVSVKTVYKWRANLYSDLEMIAGKKSKPLCDLSVALDEWANAQPPKPKTPKTRQIIIPPYRAPEIDNEWEPTDEDHEYYRETGIMRGASTHDRHRAEYDALVAWIENYNAGVPVSPHPPQGEFFKLARPSNAPPPQPPKTAPNTVSDICADEDEDEAGYDDEYEEVEAEFDPDD